MTADEVDLDFVRGSARDFLAGRGENDSLKDLAAMDWTGLLVDDALGGSGWLPVEASVVAEELGRARDRSAWLGTAVAAGALASAPVDIRDRWLPGMIDGSVAAGLALSGTTVRVARGDEIDVVVTVGGEGIQLFEVAAGLSRSCDAELLDVSGAVGRMELSGAQGLLIGAPGRAEQLLAVAKVLLSADSLGALSSTFERLVAYLRERTAFGAPIASFQAVQHRLVDLLVFETKARAIIMKAARALASADTAGEAVALAAVAHAFVTAKATAAVDECMQLSGGIGFTWEYPLHHELRRVFSNAFLLGTSRASRAVIAQKAGW